MNPGKFWKMVERDPWLLWVIYVGRQLRCGDLLTDPSLLGQVLSPSDIREKIAYIAFRPWEKLDLDFKKTEKSTVVETSGDSSRLDAWLEATIYWHTEVEEDTLGIDNFSQVLTLGEGQTIQQALDSLKEGSKVDAVVLTGTMDRRKGKDILAQLFDSTSEPQYSESYDIYRLDQPSQPTQTRW